MSMWNAASDRDYSTECHGPYAQLEERESRHCHRVFKHFRDEEYEPTVLCDDCKREARTRGVEW